MADDLAAMQAYYARDEERDRLDTPVGRLEYARTIEIVQPTLPPLPAAIADIGGGPGRYTDWLVATGYSVILRDIVAHHVDQVRERHGGRVDAAWGDARALDIAGASVDGVLLLGPLYHLPSEDDRLAALREAARIVRPGGVVYAAAISRWATRLHGILLERFHCDHPQLLDMVDEMERSGRLAPVHEASFTGYAHRPDDLRDEIGRAGLVVESLVGVEGPGFLLGDLAARLDDPDERAVLLDSLRAVERVPELLGVGPHLLATARRPAQ
jgi:SAM-dependent methyltransferase